MFYYVWFIVASIETSKITERNLATTKMLENARKGTTWFKSKVEDPVGPRKMSCGIGLLFVLVGVRGHFMQTQRFGWCWICGTPQRPRHTMLPRCSSVPDTDHWLQILPLWLVFTQYLYWLASFRSLFPSVKNPEWVQRAGFILVRYPSDFFLQRCINIISVTTH